MKKRIEYKKYPNLNTKIFISVAKNPGITGSKFYNSIFQKIKYDGIYIPIKCLKFVDLKNILKLKFISGISVSTPYKNVIIKLLDKIDNAARITQSVNTVIRVRNRLIGYNTDFHAAKRLIQKTRLNKRHKVLLIGSGAVARTFYEALKNKTKFIYLCARNKSKFNKWDLRKTDVVINWNDKSKIKTFLLVNATIVGMKHLNKKILFSEKNITNFEWLIDVVNNPNSILQLTAKKMKVKFLSGLEMSFYQAIKQFNIYTSVGLKEKKVKNILNYKI
jgi:shikimate 5-dehydrogenase